MWQGPRVGRALSRPLGPVHDRDMPVRRDVVHTTRRTGHRSKTSAFNARVGRPAARGADRDVHRAAGHSSTHTRADPGDSGPGLVGQASRDSPRCGRYVDRSCGRRLAHAARSQHIHPGACLDGRPVHGRCRLGPAVGQPLDPARDARGVPGRIRTRPAGVERAHRRRRSPGLHLWSHRPRRGTRCDMAAGHPCPDAGRHDRRGSRRPTGARGCREAGPLRLVAHQHRGRSGRGPCSRASLVRLPRPRSWEPVVSQWSAASPS